MNYQIFDPELDIMEQKLLQNFDRPTETVFCQGLKFFGGLNHFQKEVSRMKMNQAAERHFQKLMKMSTKFGILFVQIVG